MEITVGKVCLEIKKWYKSKTIRANALVAIIMILQYATGTQLLDPDVQTMLVALLNILLRFKTATAIG